MPESIKQISFGKLEQGMEMPHLLDIQTQAFEALLQTDAAAHEREDVGLERVFVGQLHRSPGVVFEEATHPNGQRLISARIIPFRGSWVEFTVDIHDVIYVHIDKKKKFPATALLRAFGYGTNSDILRLFFAVRELDLVRKRESRGEQREVLGAITAEDIAL